ncbi:hypothetical protein [Actinacidiphila sp. bgisy145]|uniref:hypothetical protein n=1 Tax=Actinacidiphila sp. bgisy145 TaxID=3413792 RepID=UPI003EBC9F1D
MRQWGCGRSAEASRPPHGRVAGHVLDPSRTPEYNPELPAKGVTAKTVDDATRPYALRDMFRRARFRDVGPTPWYPDYPER